MREQRGGAQLPVTVKPPQMKETDGGEKQFSRVPHYRYYPISGSEGKCLGSRCFLRLPSKRMSACNPSSTIICGRSPAAREEPALHAPGAQAHQPQTAGTTRRSTPCNVSGGKEARRDKKKNNKNHMICHQCFPRIPLLTFLWASPSLFSQWPFLCTWLENISCCTGTSSEKQ